MYTPVFTRRIETMRRSSSSKRAQSNFWLRSAVTMLLLIKLEPIEAFVHGSARPKRRSCRLFAEINENDEQDMTFNSKGKSKMPGYMASFLDKQNDNSDEPTHMIGIPMSENYGLLLQLESVQRAVIHHCPTLIRSAIVPAMTRLPMFNVYARYKNGKQNTAQPDVVTQELHKIVKRVVEKRINIIQDENLMGPMDEEAEVMRGPNASGYRPLVLTFEKLQIEGEDNDVLLTAAKENDPQTRVLQDLHAEIQREVEALGYKTSLPPDEENNSGDWRPRIPFMRLPSNYQEMLPPIEEEEIYRKPEQGGNGISPIFWCQWWDDVFGEHVRLGQVGVYARSSNDDNEERAFYVAHETVDLPQGNAALTQDEARDEAYQKSRMEETEKEVSGVVNDDDIPDSTVQEAREQLESAFANIEAVPPNDDGLVATIPVDGTIIDTDNVDPEEDTSQKKANTIEASSSKQDEVVLDEWTRERIRRAVEDRESVKARTMSKPTTKPPPMDENPVFQQYREERDKKRRAAERGEDSSGTTSEKGDTSLPRIPSEEEFIGAWNLVSSPIPSELELTNGEIDESKSDNIILRVDGTTFGGPILDREMMHKAAGGTWKNYEEDEESADSRAKLRIRLVVPPAKERILVMEGDVTRLMMPSSRPTTRSSFGVPMLEQANEQLDEIKSSYDKLLQCDGLMWIEDARTGANRKDLGSFLLMKMDQSDPSDYVITIPRSVRNQD